MAQENEKIYAKVHSPFEVFFEGNAVSVSASNKVGPFDILPGHANFLTILEPKPVEVHLKQEKISIPIDGGIMWVRDDKVEVFANL